MNSEKKRAIWSDDAASTISIVMDAVHQIRLYDSSEYKLFCLKQTMEKVCDIWTGNTYIGESKPQDIKNAFQIFFEELMNLLVKMSEQGMDFEKEFSQALLYRGSVYRYLGNNHPSNKIIRPEYDSFYVSWSKEPTNSYIRSKLYGPITWLSCDIEEPLYGLDLEPLNCSRGKEYEVVFPTLENCITEIRYISEVDDE